MLVQTDAELQNLHTYPSGRLEAVLKVVSRRKQMVGLVSPNDLIKVIIPAGSGPISMGPLSCRSDFFSDIRHTFKPYSEGSVSKRVLSELKKHLPANTHDELRFKNSLLERLNLFVPDAQNEPQERALALSVHA
ncbi:MAG: hypothetical protein VKJ06_01000 [Vampirovibrionales bacterium]|nr:hypothetical protein [Vampirovibrionales bacterium]